MGQLSRLRAFMVCCGVLVLGAAGCAYDREPGQGAVDDGPVEDASEPMDVAPLEDLGPQNTGDAPDVTPPDSPEDAEPDAEPDVEPDVGEPNLRVEDGLLALYRFESLSEGVIPDEGGASEFELALVSGELLPVEGYGATMLQGSRVLLEDSTPLIESLSDAQAFSFEIWCRPYNITQGGPARLLGVEEGLYVRNMLLGQERDYLAIRLRVGEDPSPDTTFIPDAFSAETPSHVVLTFDGEAQRAEVYVNGEATPLSLPDAATLEFWDLSHQFTMWDTNTGERPWSGDMHMAAIYNRALSPDEVATNFAAGVTGLALSSPPSTLRVEALTAVVVEDEGAVGEWKISREGDIDEPLEVAYRLQGSAELGLDYVAESVRSVTIPAGESFVKVAIEVSQDEVVEGEEVVSLQLLPAADYDIQAPRKATMVLRDAELTPPTRGLLNWLQAARAPSLLGERVEQWPDSATGSNVAVEGPGWPAMLIEQDGRAMSFDGGSAYQLAPDDGVAIADGLVLMFLVELDDAANEEFVPFLSMRDELDDAAPANFVISARRDGGLMAEWLALEGDDYLTVFSLDDALSGRALVTLSFRPVLGALFRLTLRVNGEVLFEDSSFTAQRALWRSVVLGHVRRGNVLGARVMIRELLFYNTDPDDIDLTALERELIERHGVD